VVEGQAVAGAALAGPGGVLPPVACSVLGAGQVQQAAQDPGAYRLASTRARAEEPVKAS
jgi:hypothetical protein